MTSFFGAFLARLRYLFFIPVLVLVGLSLVSMASGVAAALRLLGPRPEGGSLPGSPAEMAGAVPFFVQSAFLFFLAVALSSLFIGELPVPQWMAVRNLHQLKNKLLTFLSVILGLFFLGFAAGGGEPIGILYAGGGVALVLGAIFVLLRFGHTAGDDSFCREGTRCLQPEARGEPRAPEARREARPKAPEPEPLSGKDWLTQQKDQLRFEVESLNAAMGSAPGGRGGETPAGQVTVGQAPRRHPEHHGRNRGRRRGRGGGGGGGQQGGGSGPSGGGEPPA